MFVTRGGTQFGIVGSLCDTQFGFSPHSVRTTGRMSLRVVGVVALAGLTAVAAYILLFRKKEEETADEPKEETLKIPEKDQTKDEFEHVPKTPDKDQNKHVADSETLEEGTTRIGSIEDNNTSTAPTIEKKSEVGEDTSNRTESLMEWIDRQLKEAESKSRNVTPDPDTKAADSQNSKNSSPERDLGKNVTERKETDTTVNVEVTASEESFTSEIKQVEAAPVSFTSMSVEEYKEDEKPNAESIEIIEFNTENFAIQEEANIPPPEESFATEIKQVEAAAVSFTSTTMEENKEETQNDNSNEIIELTTENFAIQEETILNNAREPIKSLEITEPIQTNIDGTEKCILEEDQSIESNDIKVDSQEERIFGDKFENSHESLNHEDLDSNAESEPSIKPKECMIDFETDTNSKIIDQLQHTNEANFSAIGTFDLSVSDYNSNTLVAEEDVNKDSNEAGKLHFQSVNSDAIIEAELNLSETNGHSDEQESEVSHEKNDLAEIAESAGTDLAKTADVEIASFKDPECSKISHVDDDEGSDAEIQLLKEDSERKDSKILEDSDYSENESDSGSSVESVNTEVTIDEAKSDEDYLKETNGNSEEESKDELNDSIGLMLRPSWQIKKPQKTLNEIDEKLTSI